MNSQSVAPFDVTEHLRQRVREVFIASIPDEQLDQMIRKEMGEFFQSSQNGYGQKLPSKFSALIGEMLQDLLKQKLTQWFSDNFEQVYDDKTNQTRIIGETVAELIPIVQQKMMKDLVERTLGELRQRSY